MLLFNVKDTIDKSFLEWAYKTVLHLFLFKRPIARKIADRQIPKSIQFNYFLGVQNVQ